MTGRKLIARKVSRGANAREAKTLLVQLTKEYTGNRLVSALVYWGYATETQAESYVAGGAK